MSHQPFDIGRRDGSFRACYPDASLQLFVVKVLAPPVLLDDQGHRQDRPLIRAKALLALEALPPPANASVAVVRGVEHLRVMIMAIRAAHRKSFPEQMLEPYVGV